MNYNTRQCRKHNFTKTFIDSLPPHKKNAKSREAEYSDQQVVGLRVLVSKNGRKFFHLRYRFQKRKKVISIGEFPAVSVQQARQRAYEYKNQLSNGLDPLIERNKQSNDLTFKEFAEKEYVPHAKVNKVSWADDVSKLENHMYPAFGQLPLSSITTRDLQKYQTKIKVRNSPSTSNRHMTVLIRMFNLAVQWQFLEKSPCNGSIKKYNEPTRERYLDNDEIKRFLSALDEANQSSVSVHVIRMLLYSGLRTAEVTKMKWENLNFTAGTLSIPENKSGKPRTVVLNQLAMNTVKKMLDFKINDYVFPGKGPKGHIISPRRVFLKIKEKAGIEGICAHSLRHTFASICVNSGENLYSVQKLLGHHSSQMTQRYAHLGDKELRAATESVANQISHITS
ncbi:MAG: tyrosine-type recombinase/integrase [Deltaproteobacteria bacterium]|jgi:integrase|nr:tyrosine-type recombinase/integrase [Deltaproteobacteria bacterium]